MTPGARVAAAISILDDMASGLAAEQALTRWARTSRFAGSKDRAAVRDHVFDVMRRKRSAAVWGHGTSGRALMLGLMRQSGLRIDAVFSGEGHAPAPMTAEEKSQESPEVSRADRLNLPDWIIPEFDRSLGTDADEVALLSQSRALVSLRVNLRRTDRAQAQADLLSEGIETKINPMSPSALVVTEGARRIRLSESYNTGLVELQDASSQAVVDSLPPGGKVLDYCAGGGGKTLALAVDPSRDVCAHDKYPARMRDLPFRADRAGVDVRILEATDLAEFAPFDVVLCDSPCSGSGAWRRSPEGKWTLTQDRLAELMVIQDDILSQTATLVAQNGILAYATCSVLACENEDRIATFLTSHPGWTNTFQKRFPVCERGDGFYIAHLTRV